MLGEIRTIEHIARFSGPFTGFHPLSGDYTPPPDFLLEENDGNSTIGKESLEKSCNHSGKEKMRIGSKANAGYTPNK